MTPSPAEKLYAEIVEHMAAAKIRVDTLAGWTSNWTEGIQVSQEFEDLQIRLSDFVRQQFGIGAARVVQDTDTNTQSLQP